MINGFSIFRNGLFNFARERGRGERGGERERGGKGRGACVRAYIYTFVC